MTDFKDCLSTIESYHLMPYVTVPRGAVFVGFKGYTLYYRCPCPEAVVTKETDAPERLSPLTRTDMFGRLSEGCAIEPGVEFKGECTTPGDPCLTFLFYKKGLES